MQSRRHTPETGETGIDLAPMLDFCVNLLIFFIITTSFIKEAGVTVFKPEAVTAEHEDSGNLLIEIRDVRTRMERLHIERPDDTVVIIADKASKAGIVAQITTVSSGRSMWSLS